MAKPVREKELMSSLFNQTFGRATQQAELNQSFGYLLCGAEVQFLPFCANDATSDASFFGREYNLIEITLRRVGVTADEVSSGDIDDVTVNFRAGIRQE